MLTMSAEEVAKRKQQDPYYEDKYFRAEAATWDSSFAYIWNPYKSDSEDHEFEHHGWSTSVYAGVDLEQKSLFITFRGTDQLIDWLINLIMLPLPFFHPTAHAGFLLTWKLSKSKLFRWIKAHEGEYDRIFVSGHSLGGALSMLCSYDMIKEGLPVERCVTVGSPRTYWCIGKKRADAILEPILIRAADEIDIVPKVPPRWLGFRHIGQPGSGWIPTQGLNRPRPVSAIEESLSVMSYWINLGPLGAYLDQQVNDPGATTRYLMLGSLMVGGAWSSVGIVIFLASLFFLAVLAIQGLALGIEFHRSAKYATATNAATRLREWRNFNLRSMIEKSETIASKNADSPGMTTVRIDSGIDSLYTIEDRQRFPKTLKKYLGKDVVDIVLQEFRSGVIQPVVDEKFSDQSDIKEFATLTTQLVLYGYTTEEIDHIIRTGKIGRPAAWQRFYRDGIPRIGGPTPYLPQQGEPVHTSNLLITE